MNTHTYSAGDPIDLASSAMSGVRQVSKPSDAIRGRQRAFVDEFIEPLHRPSGSGSCAEIHWWGGPADTFDDAQSDWPLDFQGRHRRR